MKSKRSKATDITPEVRQKVYNRDRWCIFCGNPRELTTAHYISRANGGLGIEENLAMVCMTCHHWLDNTSNRDDMLEYFKDRLDQYYPDFTDKERKYKK